MAVIIKRIKNKEMKKGEGGRISLY